MEACIDLHDQRRTLHPAPGSKRLAWLVEGRTSIPEIADGLRGTLIRRMSSLGAAAIANLVVMAIATVRHPEAPFAIWSVLGGGLIMARFGIVALIRRAVEADALADRRGLVDLFVVSSLTWSLQVGLGCLVCLRSGDPALASASVVLAMGGTGTLGSRNPGSPRLCAAQTTLTLLPFAIGLALDGDPVVRLLALFVPAYAFGLWRVASQLHGDYVDMLTAQRENRERALHCGLTGLPNASHFQQSLATAGADPRNHPLAVLALDLDGFKAVNDRHGHPAGDALLKQVAGRLRQFADRSVLACRIGGDEFAIVLLRHDGAAAERVAEQVIRTVSLPYRLGVAVATISASVGVATSRTAGSAGLHAEADRALYRAKAAGKGTWRIEDAGSARDSTGKAVTA